MNKSSESYKVYLEKAGDASSGVISSQPEGRAGLPPAVGVKEAECEPGTTIKCAKQQTGENRYPINTYVEKCHEHGPNN